MTDSFLLNGVAHGSVAAQLMQVNFDVGVLRPFLADDGGSYVTVTEGYKKRKPQFKSVPIRNAAATLTWEEWKEMDRAVVDATHPELMAWNDVRAAASYTIPNGMGKTILESRAMSDITPAEISMSPRHRADMDRPHIELTGVPLPIIHKDAELDVRELSISRQSGLPLDASFLRLGAIKVAEEVEKMTIGVGINYSFGGYSIPGMTTFAQRLTYELDDPTVGGWSPADLIDDVIGMRQASRDVGYRGPWNMYISSLWEPYFDADYSTVKGDITLRDRVARIAGISKIATLDYLENYDIILIQMTPEVARAIIGLPMTTLQWEQEGGLVLRFKIMTIMIPQFRADFYDGTGIVHGSVAVTT